MCNTKILQVRIAYKYGIRLRICDGKGNEEFLPYIDPYRSGWDINPIVHISTLAQIRLWPPDPGQHSLTCATVTSRQQKLLSIPRNHYASSIMRFLDYRW